MTLDTKSVRDLSESELGRLVSDYCCGALTDDQVQRMEVMLQDEAARYFYVAYLSLHARLSWQGWKGQSMPVQLAAPGRAKRSLVHAGGIWIRRPFNCSLLVASVCMLLLLAVAAQIRVNRHPAGPGEVASLEAFEWVAQLHYGRDARFGAGQSPVFSGCEIYRGEQFELLSGQAELAYFDGTRVRLEGPARFHVSTAKRLRLDVGKLLARVSPEGVGYTVEVGAARVVDLGTEFGINADGNGNFETHVISGRVRLESSDDAAAGTELGPNQTATYRAADRKVVLSTRGSDPYRNLRPAAATPEGLMAALAVDRPYSEQGWRPMAGSVRQTKESGFQARYPQEMLMLRYEGLPSQRLPVGKSETQRVDAIVRNLGSIDNAGFAGVLLRMQPDADQRSGFYMARIVDHGRALQLTRDIESLGENVPLARACQEGESWRLVFEARGEELSASVYDQQGTLLGRARAQDGTYATGTIGMRWTRPWGFLQCRGALMVPTRSDEPTSETSARP